MKKENLKSRPTVEAQNSSPADGYIFNPKNYMSTWQQ
jgi:hypothetical protein